MNIWSSFERARCLPDHCDCELVRDALIGQPSATLSSLAFFFFAILLFYRVKERTFTFKLWTGVMVFLGICSIFAHASFIEIALAMDFASIILVMSFFPLMRWIVRKWQQPVLVVSLLGFYYFLCWMIFYGLNKWVKVGMCVVVFFFAVREIWKAEKESLLRSKDLHLSLGILSVSFVFFLVDELKINCTPESWFQGHSLWHFGTAACLFFYGKWRFRVISSETAPR